MHRLMPAGFVGLPDLAVHQINASDLDARLAQWLPVYRACFAGPPWNEASTTVEEYRGRIVGHLRHTDLVGYEVHDGQELVAACYGWPAADTRPETGVYRMLAEAIGPDSLEELWQRRPFEFVELMVSPTIRRHGVARALVEQLCPSGPAWLATLPGSDAARLYERLGWQSAGTARGRDGVELVFYVLT